MDSRTSRTTERFQGSIYLQRRHITKWLICFIVLVAMVIVYVYIPVPPTTFETHDNQPWLFRSNNDALVRELKECSQILKSIEIEPFAEPRKVHNPVCRMDFVGYQSSTLELYMIDQVKKFQGARGDVDATKKYCKFMNSEYVKSAMEEFLNAMVRYRELSSFANEKVNTDIFSTMTYRTTCQGGGTMVNTHYIEPLIGLTRHPYAICTNKSMMSLDYILLQSFQDNLFYQRMNESEQIQYLGMDLGASTWGSSGVTNTNWFFTQYEKRRVNFDRMLMWEGRKVEGSKIWKFPPKYMSTFQYFNMWADLDPNADGNPLRILHKIARKDDFVMLKLDIDQPKELRIVIALLENRNAMELVDEFFFEHHTRTPMMQSSWGGNVACDLSDTYNIFLKLRQSGVRSHGWP